MATIKKRTSMAGTGCLLQGLGLASLVVAALTVFSVIGPVFFGLLGIWLIIYGSQKAQWWECSDCGTRLTRRNLVVCPNCHSSFKR